MAAAAAARQREARRFSAAGGGGGGFHGGGGGASHPDVTIGGAGGGGGSSLLPGGATKTIDATGEPQLQLTYLDNGGPTVTLDAMPQWINGAYTFRGTAGTQLGDGPVRVTVYRGPAGDGVVQGAVAVWPDAGGAWFANRVGLSRRPLHIRRAPV